MRINEFFLHVLKVYVLITMLIQHSHHASKLQL